MSIKKQYNDIIALLEANKNKKVSTIMPQLLELASSKTNSKTFHKDEDGNTIAIYCYYHKVWELVTEVEYGKKKSTATGLNTMCKDGISHWSKQQRVAKQAKDELLTKVANGELNADDTNDELAIIEENRKLIVAQDERVAYSTLEDALNV